MKLQEWVNIRELEELIAEGLVTDRKHPTLPLRILNYAPSAQSVKTWTDTLSKCRGLVYEEGTNDVYAIPFKKFWNYNDFAHPETLPENLPQRNPAIYEKVDGSLGIGFFYKSKFLIATRGSFESDQAKWAQNWIDERVSPVHENIDEVFTYLFEIVIPTDKKVVNYSFSGLVLLGESDYLGRSFHPLDKLHFLKDIRVARMLPYEELEKLQAQDKENEEGYVCVWFNGTDTFRCKLKFETYKRLHRMYFQTTSEVIWELAKAGEDVATHLIGADEALIKWALKIDCEIYKAVLDITQESKLDFRFAIEYTNSQYGLEASEKDRRKAFAMVAVQKKYPSLMFLYYDGKLKEAEEQVWKLVKPKNSRMAEVEEDS